MLRFKYFPEASSSTLKNLPEDAYKLFHNWETEVVERKLALNPSVENFIQEEAFLAGKLAILQEILAHSPFNK